MKGHDTWTPVASGYTLRTRGSDVTPHRSQQQLETRSPHRAGTRLPENGERPEPQQFTSRRTRDVSPLERDQVQEAGLESSILDLNSTRVRSPGTLKNSRSGVRTAAVSLVSSSWGAIAAHVSLGKTLGQEEQAVLVGPTKTSRTYTREAALHAAGDHLTLALVQSRLGGQAEAALHADGDHLTLALVQSRLGGQAEAALHADGDHLILLGV
ncbi:unnamed protein product [Lota lota]